MQKARPMQTDCNLHQLIFEGFEGRQVVGAFDGGAVTSNAGGTLLRGAGLALGLTAKGARRFRDGRAEELGVDPIGAPGGQRGMPLRLATRTSTITTSCDTIRC